MSLVYTKSFLVNENVEVILIKKTKSKEKRANDDKKRLSKNTKIFVYFSQKRPAMHKIGIESAEWGIDF